MAFDRSAPDSRSGLIDDAKGIFRELFLKGLPAAQLRSLWDAHQNRWMTFILFGDAKIREDIEADADHAWLDNTVGGKTIRQHIVDRLSLD